MFSETFSAFRDFGVSFPTSFIKNNQSVFVFAILICFELYLYDSCVSYRSLFAQAHFGSEFSAESATEMSGTDALIVLESARMTIGGDRLDGTVDLSGSGLLNSDTYRDRVEEVLLSDPLPEEAEFLLRAACMYRPKISRVLQILAAFGKKDTSTEAKRMLASLNTWIQRHMADHSNVPTNIIPIHALTQSGAAINFYIYTRLTTNLSNIQFLFGLVSQRWSVQLRVSSDSFLALHREYQRRWWSRKIVRSTRDPTSYSASSSGFTAGFVESYYSTTASDNYDVVVDGVTLGEDTFGSYGTPGYTASKFLKIREEVMLRLPKTTKLFESETLSGMSEVFEDIVELCNEEFRAEIDMLYPDKLIGKIMGLKAKGPLSPDNTDILRSVGLVGIDKRKNYRDPRVVIGSLAGVPITSCEKTHLFPTFSDETMSKAMSHVSDKPAPKTPVDPSGDPVAPTEPSPKKPKTETKVLFVLSEDMKDRVAAAKGKIAAVAAEIKDVAGKGMDSNVALALESESVEVLCCAVASSFAYKGQIGEGSNEEKSLKIMEIVNKLSSDDANTLLKSF